MYSIKSKEFSNKKIKVLKDMIKEYNRQLLNVQDDWEFLLSLAKIVIN